MMRTLLTPAFTFVLAYAVTFFVSGVKINEGRRGNEVAAETVLDPDPNDMRVARHRESLSAVPTDKSPQLNGPLVSPLSELVSTADFPTAEAAKKLRVLAYNFIFRRVQHCWPDKRDAYRSVELEVTLDVKDGVLFAKDPVFNGVVVGPVLPLESYQCIQREFEGHFEVPVDRIDLDRIADALPSRDSFTIALYPRLNCGE